MEDLQPNCANTARDPRGNFIGVSPAEIGKQTQHGIDSCAHVHLPADTRRRDDPQDAFSTKGS